MRSWGKSWWPSKLRWGSDLVLAMVTPRSHHHQGMLPRHLQAAPHRKAFIPARQWRASNVQRPPNEHALVMMQVHRRSPSPLWKPAGADSGEFASENLQDVAAFLNTCILSGCKVTFPLGSRCWRPWKLLNGTRIGVLDSCSHLEPLNCDTVAHAASCFPS